MEPESQAPVAKRALLVGINDYRSKPLKGCENDVNRLKKILPRYGFFEADIHVLLNERATKEAIVSHLEESAKCTKPGDSFLFYFSGHGSEISNRKKLNGWNETIVPYDGAGRQDIKDDEIQELLAAFKSHNVSVIFDSCHSGDITRECEVRAVGYEEKTARGVPPPDGQWDEIVQIATMRGVQYRNSRSSVFGGGWLKPANYVVLSACRDRQTAQERIFGHKYHGILTYHLCKILKEYATFQDRSWRDVHLELRTAKRSGDFKEQTPQLEGLRDWRIFGTEPTPMMRHVEISIRADGRGVLCAGFLHGISLQSQWALYPIGTHSDSEGIRPQITGLTAPLGPIRAELTGTLPQLPPSGGFVAKCRSHLFKTATKIVMTKKLDHDIAENIRDYIQSSEFLELLTCDEGAEGGWNYKIEMKNNNLALETSNRDSVAFLDVPKHEWRLFLSNLAKVAWHYGMLTATASPTDCGLTERDIDIKIITVKQISANNYKHEAWDISPQITMHEGELFYFQITNRSNAPLNLTVIEFRCGFGIRVVYPPPGGHAAPLPSSKKPKKILANADGTTVRRMEIPSASYRHSNGDAEQIFRIIFTQHPSDFTFMEQESIVCISSERFQDSHEETEIRGETEGKDGNVVKLQKQFTENPEIYFVRDIHITIKPSRKSEAYKKALAYCNQWITDTVDYAAFADMREKLLKKPLNFTASYQFKNCFTVPNQERLIIETQDDYTISVIFFHGLLGGPSQSWPTTTGESWPACWLLNHKNLKHKLRIICLSYQGNNEKPDLETVTEDAREQIKQYLKPENPTVLVAEGAGAFVLLNLLETEEDLVRATIGVAFYGLPFEIQRPLDVLLTIFEWTHEDTAKIFADFEEKYKSLVRQFVDQFPSLPVLLVQPRDSDASADFKKRLNHLKYFHADVNGIDLMEVPSMDDFVITELVSFLNNQMDTQHTPSTAVADEPKSPNSKRKMDCGSNQGIGNIGYDGRDQHRISDKQSAVQLKEQGNVAFRSGDYKKAEMLYTAALDLNCDNHILFSNRSVTRAKLKDPNGSLADANQSIILMEDFAKGWLRKAEAHALLAQWDDAAQAYCCCLELEPKMQTAQEGLKMVALDHYLALPAKSKCRETARSVIEKLDDMAMERIVLDTPQKISFYKEALQVCRAAPVLLIGILSDFGSCLHQNDQSSLAVVCYQISIGLLQHTELQDSIVSGIYGNLGTIFLELGKLKPARYHLDTALAFAPFGQCIERARVTAHYGLLLIKEGMYHKGIEDSTRALEVAENLDCVELKAVTLGNLGLAFRLIGNYERAVQFHKRGIAESKKRCHARGVATDLGNLGVTYYYAGQWDKALKYIQKAIDIDPSQFNKMNQSMHLGLVHARQALDLEKNDLRTHYHNEEALKAYTEGLGMAKILQNKGVSCILKSNMAFLLLRNFHNLSEAEKLFEESIELAGETRDVESMANSLVGHAYCLILDRKWQKAITKLEEAEKLFGKIWETLVKDDIMISWGSTPGPGVCNNLLQDAYVLLGETSKALEVLERGRSQALLEELRKKASKNIDAERNTPTHSLSLKETIEYSRSQQATLVFYGAANHRQCIFAWIVAPKMEEPVFLPLRLSEEDTEEFTKDADNSSNELALFIHTALESGLGRDGEIVTLCNSAGSFSDVDAARLYKILWKPLKSWLPTDELAPVIIFPQGPLCLIPFTALLDENGEYLIQRHTITIAPSTTVLMFQRNAAKWSKKKDGILIVGNPKMPKLPNFESFRNLPEAKEEAKVVADVYCSKVLSDERATKSRVNELLPKSRIAHIATHGLLRGRSSSYVPGALVFAARKDMPESVEECILWAEDLQQLDLSGLQLATLSCCYSGQGKVKAEGLLGFGRAFLFAGCENVVLALWTVSDTEATRSLMKEFNQKYLETRDAAKALREAILPKIKKIPLRDWAPFYVFGACSHKPRT